MEFNETSPPTVVEYDDDFLKNMSDSDYVDFVAQFLKPTPIEYIFVGIYLCLFLIGIVGNCLVVYVVLRNKAMLSSLNLWLVNLAISDILILAVCLPPTVATDITKTFWFDITTCKAILFAQNTSVYVSVLTLICVSIERWRAVTNPLAHQLWRTIHVIPCVWIIAFLLSLPEPFTLQIFPADYERSNLQTKWGTRCKESWSENFQQKYQITQTLLLFFCPLLIISILCIHMSLILRQKALQVGERQLRNRKKATQILIGVTLLFGISYLPVHLHNIANAFHFEPQEEPSLLTIAIRKFVPRFFAYSSSSFNPILYNFTCEKFRKEFKRAFCFGDKNSRKMSQAARNRSTRYSSVSGTNL